MSDLVGNPEDRFSRVEAHMMNGLANIIIWMSPHSFLGTSGEVLNFLNPSMKFL